MTVNPIPEGSTSVTPYLAVDDGREAIEFYKRAFEAKVRSVLETAEGWVAHAELEIGGGVVMLSNRFPQSPQRTPKEVGATTVAIHLYVEDVDWVVQTAADAGATIVMEPADQFWGDRFGQVLDPFGHLWQIVTHVEDVAPEEVEARSREALANMAA